MSNIFPPLLIPVADRNNTESVSKISLPPLSSWPDTYRAFSSFSSPPRSSSPPMTPFSLQSHVYTRVISSPDIASEHEHYAQSDHSDKLPSTWDRSNAYYPAAKTSATGYSLPSFQSTFASQHSLPSSSRHDASVLYDGESTRFQEKRSYSPGDVRARYSNVFYDSEEESHDEGTEFSSEGDTRATFFRTSAERGQWRHDPIPVKPHPRQQIRNSIASWSPPALSVRQHAPRPISEPAPSTSRPLSPAVISDLHDEHEQASELPFAFPMHGLPSDHRNMMCDARRSLPSLMSDRDTSPEQEEMHPSSPLPPSSPPLSHMSYTHSPMARSISPLSFAPSPPPPASSSPLMFSSSVDHDDVEDDESGTSHLPADPEAVDYTEYEPPAARTLETEEEMVDPPTVHDSDSESLLAPACATIAPSPTSGAVVVLTDIEPISVAVEETLDLLLFPLMTHDAAPEAISPVDGSNRGDDQTDSAPESVAKISEQVVEVAVLSSDKALIQDADPGVHDSDNVDIEVDVRRDELEDKARATTADPIALHLGVVISDVTTGGESGDVKGDGVKEKRKTQMEEESRHDGPPRKKVRANAPKPLPTASEQDEKRMSEDEGSDEARSAPRVKKQKKSDKVSRKRAQQTSQARSDASASTSRPPHPSDEPSSELRRQDADMSELDSEITGMLIECMATSRASSLPISTLCKSVLECRPSLKAQRSEKEWATVFRQVLRNGATGSGVFGKVESSGKDDSDRPLEAQWFYVPERDGDQERATLIRSMMPRPGKRSETKKYKQYYYRPLEKISRWDGEDDI